MALDVVSQSCCFGGIQFTYQHQSSETGTLMRFAAFVPPRADHHPVPVVWYLSGLTCTEENFTVKAGAQLIAAELGLLLIAPDTSPRGDAVPCHVFARPKLAKCETFRIGDRDVLFLPFATPGGFTAVPR
jgi:S-formylglutathione hydrolase